MWLRLSPFGEEVGVLAAACRDGTHSGPRGPLTEGAGPELAGLAHRSNRGTGACLGRHCRGQYRVRVLLPDRELGRSVREPGTRLRIPVRTVEGVVLPVAALTRRGPDRIAFESHGDHFHELVVRVLYEDDEVVSAPCPMAG